MTIETEVAGLTQATTDLLDAVNVKKAALDAAEANAVNALDSFESQYIGARSSAPATDADGDPLQTGALYYNTTDNTMYVYSGSAWDALVDNLVIDPNATMSNNIATNGNDIKFGDNDKATFGASDDLQIYHDGSTNRVVGSVDVTGTVTADGLTVDSDNASELIAGGGYGDTNTAKLSLRGGFGDNGRINGFGIKTTRTTPYISGATLDFIKESRDVESGKALTITEGGDVSFYEDTGTTAKFVWDSSAESLSIGSTLPYSGQTLTVGDSAPKIQLDNGAGTLLASFSHTGTTDNTASLINQRLGSFTFGTNNTERMRIDSSGNVGIGTVSPSEKLEVSGKTKASEFRASSGSGAKGYDFTASGSGAGVANMFCPSGFTLAFGTNNTERARIDSSGNLLFGTTNTAPYATSTETGVKIFGNGTLTASTSATSAILNTLNDGTIIDFRKDGGNVGSIGVNSTYPYFARTGAGLIVRSSDILPCNSSGATVDASIDIGDSAGRFKDLYLSGGVYLGGTGSGNKLDDYETGEFTPSFAGAGLSITHDNQIGYYVKVGRAVHFRIFLGTDGVSGGSPTTNLSIAGLPFTSNTQVTSGSIGFIYNTQEDIKNARWLISGTILTLYTNDTTTAFENVHTDALGTGVNSNRTYVTGTYFTDS